VVTRKFHCPVVYPEPFVMNNAEVIRKIASAQDQGWNRTSLGENIYAEYARGVYKGIVEHWLSAKKKPPPPQWNLSP